MMVCIGRLPGPISLGWPLASEKQAPRFCSTMPETGVTILAPKAL